MTINNYFDKFIGQRLGFTATYCSSKKHIVRDDNFVYKITVQNVYEVSSGELFRDVEYGKQFKFSAELNNYLRQEKMQLDGLTYKTRSVGLKDIKKVRWQE